MSPLSLSLTRRRSSLATVAASLTLIFGVGGCSAVGAASSTDDHPSPGATSTVGTSPLDWDIALSKCIRAHGVTDYPDPKPGGGRETTANGYAGLHEAAEKCEPEVTARLGARPVADWEKPDPDYENTYKSIYDCLREAGHDIALGENVSGVSDHVWRTCDPDSVVDHD